MAPANFRTYEGQLRLLTAVIAAHPDLRLNYKDLAKHYGSDWTESGVEHFFRPIKKNGTAIRAMVKRGEDAALFVHRSFQFRAIKQNADKMRQGKGATAPQPATPGGAAGNTPKTPRTTGTGTGGGGRKRAAPSTGKTPASKKAKSAAATAATAGEIIDDDSEDDLPPMKPVAFKSNVNEEAVRAHEARMGFGYPPETAPSLASAQAASPEDDDEDLKVITPADAAPSFSNNSQQSYAPAYSFSQSTGPAGGASSRYEASPFFDNASYHHGKEAAYNADDDGDDDDYAV